MGNLAHAVAVKGGGLGDISAGLIEQLQRKGHFEIHIAMPLYAQRIRSQLRLSDAELGRMVRLLGEEGIHLIRHSAFAHTGVYEETELHPSIRRAEALQAGVVTLLDYLQPELIHCNDWMTGLLPAAARARQIKSLFTLHNIFTQYETLENVYRSGIDVTEFMNNLYYTRYPGFEGDDWRRNVVDFTASGIYAADWFNTVSATFLDELVRGDLPALVPAGVRDAVRKKYAGGRASGILNAPNDSVNPSVSRHITCFDTDSLPQGKAVNKEDLQRAMGLRREPDRPLLFWPNRLYEQKGPDLLLAVVRRCLTELGAQVAVVASGDAKVERALGELSLESDGHMAYRPFQEWLSELGKAGSDFLLMPSRYEPSGLPQMEGPRYGTLPIVRATGGLRDTVEELDWKSGTGNGFLFEDYSASALLRAIGRAVAFYQCPVSVRLENLCRIREESLQRFSFERTAGEYAALYERLLAED